MPVNPQHPPGTALVGCAGWNVPHEVGAFFPPEGSHLERYAAVWGAVEINSSFYRPHRPATYARWAASVPPAFRFEVKTPRTITHHARLVDVEQPLAQFASEANALGDKLGCVLVQLPPSLAFDTDVATRFFAYLKAAFTCMLACEARHPSWFSAEASQLLEAWGVTRVWADPPAGQTGAFAPTTNASYLRLHGSPPDVLLRICRRLLGRATRGIGPTRCGQPPCMGDF